MKHKATDKYIIFISIFLLIVAPVYSQEKDTLSVNNEISTNNDSIKQKKPFFLFKIFKKKNKKDTVPEQENENKNDTVKSKKHKFSLSLKNIFKRKNKNTDSISVADSLQTDTLQNDTLQTDSTTNKNKLQKPQKITLGTWNAMNAEQQDSLLKAWDDYDREFYIKKYSPSKFTRKIAMKKKKNFIDKLILKRETGKPYRYRRKLINRKIARYRKTMRFDRLKSSDTAPSDSLSDKDKYKQLNKKFKRQAKQEAIRKNKVILKYDKKEERLRRRYKLNENEIKILNKGKGMRLKGSELIIFKKARKKQEKFTKKLLKLRRKRSFALQNKKVQKEMKQDKKRIAKRDKTINKKRKKKKRNKEKNKKHDSSEYPKRYF